MKTARSATWISGLLGVTAVAASNNTCPSNTTTLHLPDPPYENYFYSDCYSSTHVIITSPLSSSNLDVISPRLLVAWPAGNSGIVTFFEPENGEKGTLSVQLENSTTASVPLEPIYVADASGAGRPRVGVAGLINFNSSAVLSTSILGSIRTIRDYTEGGGILYPSVQDAVNYSASGEGGVTLGRTWFDNMTTTRLTFTPVNGSDAVKINSDAKPTLHFGAGTYQFNASFNYPQLEQLSPQEVLNNISTGLVDESPDQTTSLSFLSYTDKLLAGTWRFLTYFGRDTMISLLLLQPVLSEGEGGAVEAVISAVLERINGTDGTVCHEEVIGDYATFLNLQKNNTSTTPLCDYKMIDTDFYLPIVLKNYFVDTETGRNRTSAFLNRTASFFPSTSDATYAKLAQLTAEKIMHSCASFAGDGGQIKDNLIHLKEGESVGQWRDSGNGLSGGRIPYDVNTALVPAALRSIAALSAAGFFADHPDWSRTATAYATVWEDETLQFFNVSISQSTAVSLVESYVNKASFAGPSHTDLITSEVNFYGLAMDANNNQAVVKIMNTDDCFRLFLLNTTNQIQLSSFLNQSAEHILQPFPLGLSSEVGLFVSNPAYSGNPDDATGFTRSDYHGTVVWGWQLAMTAAGLARQLGRCGLSETPGIYIQLLFRSRLI
jgi:hypothetical protein